MVLAPILTIMVELIVGTVLPLWHSLINVVSELRIPPRSMELSASTIALLLMGLWATLSAPALLDVAAAATTLPALCRQLLTVSLSLNPFTALLTVHVCRSSAAPRLAAKPRLVSLVPQVLASLPHLSLPSPLATFTTRGVTALLAQRCVAAMPTLIFSQKSSPLPTPVVSAGEMELVIANGPVVENETPPKEQ